MSTSSLHLYFSDVSNPGLYQTVFNDDATGEKIYGLRGRTGPRGSVTFTWGAACQAVSMLFVKAALRHVNKDPSPLPLLSGNRGSPAASIAHLIERRGSSWLHELFGYVSPNRPRLNRLIILGNGRISRP